MKKSGFLSKNDIFQKYKSFHELATDIAYLLDDSMQDIDKNIEKLSESELNILILFLATYSFDYAKNFLELEKVLDGFFEEHEIIKINKKNLDKIGPKVVAYLSNQTAVINITK